jgi:hypoxanthine phosphoribosyltransferase
MINELEKDIDRVLFSEDDIKAMVQKVAAQLNEDYAGRKPVLVILLKGSVVFAADLMRALVIDCEIDFMKVSSYAGTQSTGVINIVSDLRCDIAGRNVIIVEDIIDTGSTLKKLKGLLESRNPASLKICTLLDKPTGRKTDISADYIGGEVGNEFIVGYGLDFDEKYRNLPYIGVMRNS